jgi:F-type H+-transporting ATPase subunit delta
MGDRSVARRYAKAFLVVATEAGKLDRLADDLDELVRHGRAGGGELFNVLENPAFTLEERKGVLTAVLDRLEVEPLSRNLLMLLLDKGRFAAVESIASIFGEMADEKRGRTRVVVETAEELSRSMENEVRTALERVTGKQVVLDMRVNPALIGGIVARVGSKVYDASVRARLDDLRQRLIMAQTPAEA